MKIRKHICFNPHNETELLIYLRKNNISFTEENNFCVLDIYDNSPHWFYVEKMVKEKKMFCLSDTIFSKQELQCAEWLSVRSKWHFAYPQPEDTFFTENTTYSKENYCSECGSGKQQILPFFIKEKPKWGRRHFAQLNWIFDELFINNTAKIVLEKANISGITFREVNNKNGKEILENIYQLVVPTILDYGLIEEPSSFKEITICPKCGIKKFVQSGMGMLSYRKELFNNVPDFVKSAEIFGSKRGATRQIIVRQNVYQSIVEKDLGRGLIFSPIRLV